MKKKILYVSPNGYMGGAERFVCQAVLGHKLKQKVEAEVLFMGQGAAYDFCQTHQIKTYLLQTKFRMRQGFQLLKALLELRSLIRKSNPDIIHTTMPYAHIMVVLSSFMLKKKIVWFQHGPVGGKLDSIANWLKVDRILFNSKFLLQEHMQMFGAKRNLGRTTCINYGIENMNTSDHVAQDSFSNLGQKSKKIVLSAGRLCSWKGQHILIEAIYHLKEKNIDLFTELEVYIVGSALKESDKRYEKLLRDKISSYQLSEKIKMIPHQGNINDWMKKSWLFVHSSTTPEPFGLVVAESMLNNLLVLGADQGGITDILINEKTGFSYSTTASNAAQILADKMIMIAKLSPEQQEQIKTKAKENIKKDYSVAQMIESLEAVYSEL